MEEPYPEDEAHAERAYEIMRGWQWVRYDPDGFPSDSSMSLSDAFNRLAFDGHQQPKVALLNLFTLGKITAIASYTWKKHQGSDTFYMDDSLAPIPIGRWQALANGLAEIEREYRDFPWPLTTVDLEKLGLKDREIAEWRPEHDRFSYAMKSPTSEDTDPAYFEEAYHAWDIAILPLAMPGPDGQIVGDTDQVDQFDTTNDDSRFEGAKRGRRPEYNWLHALNLIWGQIYRGELIPDKQAEIERALQTVLARGDKEPSESTVRPYAKQIWEEFSKADNSSIGN